MTSSPDADNGGNPNTAQLWLINACVGALQSVVESMTQERPEITWNVVENDALADPSTETWSWWSSTFSMLPETAIVVGAKPEAWSALGRSVLATLGVDQASVEDIQATCRDLVAQLASAVGQRLAERLETSVSSGDAASSGRPTAAYKVDLVIDSLSTTLRVAFDELLLQCLTPVITPNAANSSAVPLQPFHYLPLHLQLVFGRTRVPLGDIVKWTVGTVIETGQLTTEPVDIICDDVVFARGRVVLCGGTYGVKIVSWPSLQKGAVHYGETAVKPAGD
jgi:flagellar motor switch/type III secretory pathway protein FliN